MQNPYGRYSQYYQYPPSYPNYPPQQIPQQNQQPQLKNQNPQLSLPFPQIPNQLPAQPLPNPNNKNPQNTYMIEGQQFPTYMITPLDLNDVQLRSGRILEKKSIL